MTGFKDHKNNSHYQGVLGEFRLRPQQALQAGRGSRQEAVFLDFHFSFFLSGKKPQLLIDKSRTKNVTARKRALLGGPSDRIGANYTPSAKHLLLRWVSNQNQANKVNWKQGVEETSSKVLGEAGSWVETGHILIRDHEIAMIWLSHVWESPYHSMSYSHT